jgi:hypothetical protein
MAAEREQQMSVMRKQAHNSWFVRDRKSEPRRIEKVSTTIVIDEWTNEGRLARRHVLLSLPLVRFGDPHPGSPVPGQRKPKP